MHRALLGFGVLMENQDRAVLWENRRYMGYMSLSVKNQQCEICCLPKKWICADSMYILTLVLVFGFPARRCIKKVSEIPQLHSKLQRFPMRKFQTLAFCWVPCHESSLCSRNLSQQHSIWYIFNNYIDAWIVDDTWFEAAKWRQYTHTVVIISTFQLEIYASDFSYRSPSFFRLSPQSSSRTNRRVRQSSMTNRFLFFFNETFLLNEKEKSLFFISQ